MRLLLALLCAGCCRIDFELPRRQRDEPPPPGPSVDLGEAAFPAGTRASAAEHAFWTPKLEPQKYRLGYKLGDGEAAAMLDDYHRWANGVGHKKLDEGRFQWRPPKGCLGGMQCVYDELEEEDRAAVAAITERFRRRVVEAKLEADGAAALVVSFVQEIEYRVPEEEPFGVMPPALVARKKEGDCDSKSLLAYMVLRSLGIRSVLISSEAHKHTMLGVALPAAGTTFTWDGSRYAFVEMTAKRSPIGHVNPELLRPNDWRVVATRSAGSAASAIRVE